MTPTYVSLSSATIDAALKLMAAFYSEEGLDYQKSRARTALHLLLANRAHGLFQFIQLGGETVGYFVVTIGISLEFGGRFALLDEFYVDAEHRGHGAGMLALGYIQLRAAALGVAALRLEVDRANPRVRAFYERAGFLAHDRDLMTRWLSAPAPGGSVP